MKISSKFKFNTVFLLIMILTIGAVLFYSVQVQNKIMGELHHTDDIVVMASRLNQISMDVMIAPSKRSREQWYGVYHALFGHINNVEYDTGFAEQLFLKLRRNAKSINQVFTALVQSNPVIPNAEEGSRPIQNELRTRLVSQIMIKSQDIVTTAQQLHGLADNRLSRAQFRNNVLIFGTVILVAVLMLLNSILVAKSISKPIIELKKGIQLIAKGQLSNRINMKVKDEIGEVSAAVDEMAENLAKITVSKELLSAEIKERKQFETALRESEERLRKILQTSPNAVVVYDIQGFPQFINQSFTDIFGWTLDEIQGRHIPFVPRDQKNIARAKIEALYTHGKPIQFLARRLTKYGEVLDVNISAAVYKDSNEKNIGLIVNLADITEQLIIEGQLRQAQKMESVGRLAGGVAHDFNNMLGVILGNSEILMEDLGLNHPFFSFVKEIQKAAERSADLTKQLLAFARKQTISPEIIDLNLTIEGMLNMLRRLIGEDINLSWRPKTPLWPVKIDPSQVDQVLANLCVNARDAIRDGGKIDIETDNIHFDQAYCKAHSEFKLGEYVLISIRDNGCGMSKDTIDNLFEPFFTTKKVGEGTGLGLATVYGIITQNSGFIKVDSKPGKGSTFNLYIPRHGDSRIERAATTEEVPRKGFETILLVEDEKPILQMTKKMLERLGYTVLAANTPGEAIRISHDTTLKIDLLITDVVMPFMNGRKLAAEIAKMFPDMKCLYMSGYTADIIAHRGVLDEGLNFINKPFSKKDLSGKIREILDAF